MSAEMANEVRSVSEVVAIVLQAILGLASIAMAVHTSVDPSIGAEGFAAAYLLAGLSGVVWIVRKHNRA